MMVLNLPSHTSEITAPTIAIKYTAAVNQWNHAFADSSVIVLSAPFGPMRYLVIKTTRMELMP